MRCTIAALAGVALLAACSAESPTGPIEAPDGPQFVAPPAQVSGTLTGPDGTNLCNFFPAGTLIRVRLFDTDLAPLIGGTQIVTCPTNTYAMTAVADTYAVAVQPLATTFGTLPFRWLDPVPVDNTTGPVVRDVQVLDGQPLPGSVTRDGAGLPGLGAFLAYGSFGQVLTTNLVSDGSGAWTETFGRSPMLLQAGLSYRFTCPTDFLASAPVGTSMNGIFAFPGGISSFDCAFVTSEESRFLHNASRLAITPLAGDIGGLNGDALGWGVQFPIAPGSEPTVGLIGSSELFRGGLVIGLSPDRILSGYTAAGFHQCGGIPPAGCQDFTPLRPGHIAHQGSAGRKITWEMTDAGSPDAIGLDVRQRSFDRAGQGGDFVWFEYRLENRSNASHTLYAGFWGDWDIGEDPVDDFGETAMGGQLMFFHNDDGSGPFLGSLIVGPAPVAGNMVYGDQQNGPGSASTARQYELISGAVTSPTTLVVADQRAYHTIGPITIARKGKATFWVAIVAGETEAELLANAAAALAHRPPPE